MGVLVGAMDGNTVGARLGVTDGDRLGADDGMFEGNDVGGTVVVHSAIDNLLKGASGQAVQNMNLIFGLEETLGLRLKGAAF